MKQYTVRGISPEVERKIAEEARNRGVSINRALVSLLERVAGAAGSGGKREPYSDLDELLGVWTASQQKQFQKSLKDQREIDEELWRKTG